MYLFRGWCVSNPLHQYAHDDAGPDHCGRGRGHDVDHCSRLPIRDLATTQPRQVGLHRVLGKYSGICSVRLGRLLLQLYPK